MHKNNNLPRSGQNGASKDQVKMSDSEKSVDGMSPAPNDRNRIEKPVLDDEGKERDSIHPNDAAGSEKGDGDEKKEEEKKSSLKDYIVSCTTAVQGFCD